MFAAAKAAHYPTFSEWVQIAVAGATVFLAIFTAVMAKRTADMAEATKDVALNTKAEAEAVREQTEAVLRQVEATRAAVQASIRPWLTSVPGSKGELNMLPSDSSFRVSFRVRNVGNGIALIKPDGVKIVSNGRRPGALVERWGHTVSSVLEPGGQTGIAFLVEGHGATLSDFSGKRAGLPEELEAEITYTDNEGQQACTARLRAAPDSRGFWHFFRIDYTRENESVPFASVQAGVNRVD